VNQLHDFNPGITPNGLFWIVQVPDSAVQVSGNTLTIHLQNVAVVDQLQFPTGTGHAPVTLSFDVTYTRSGNPRKVEPSSHDPLSPFNWEGQIWTATNSGTFSATYNDGSFSAQGSFSSSGFFGEMGTEQNGSFVDSDAVAANGVSLPFEQGPSSGAEPALTNRNETTGPRNYPRLKGRVLLTSSL